jgi:hypothetical protein
MLEVKMYQLNYLQYEFIANFNRLILKRNYYEGYHRLEMLLLSNVFLLILFNTLLFFYVIIIYNHSTYECIIIN